MRTLAMLLAVASCACVFPQSSLAASYAAKERAAKKACLTGDADKGVSILADLFIETDDLVYIFNQGRCYEQNRRYEDAIGRFREYLIKGDRLRPSDRADAEKHIAACESYLAKAAPSVAAEAPRPTALPQEGSPAVEQVLAQPLPAASAAVVRDAPLDATAGRGLRISGIAAASVGVGALIAGVAFNLKANSMASDLEKPESYSRSTDASRKNYKSAAWLGYGAGAALVASGGVLYYLGWRQGRSPFAKLAVAPIVSGDVVGTVLKGAF